MNSYEKLSVLVQQCKCLYDKHLYKDENVKQNAWCEIAGELDKLRKMHKKILKT